MWRWVHSSPSHIPSSILFIMSMFPGGSDGKASVYNVRDLGLIPVLGRFPREGNGNPLQYSCLENPMDRGAGCRLLSMGSQRVGHDWATSLHFTMASVLLRPGEWHLLSFYLITVGYLLNLAFCLHKVNPRPVFIFASFLCTHQYCIFCELCNRIPQPLKYRQVRQCYFSLEPSPGIRPILLQSGLAPLQTAAQLLPWDFPSPSGFTAKAWDSVTGGKKKEDILQHQRELTFIKGCRREGKSNEAACD